MEWTTKTHAMAYTVSRLRRVRHLRRLLVGTLVFNLVDLVLTLAVVLSGLAIEANPFMAELLERSPLVFGVVKLALVSMGVWIIWRHRHRPVAIFAGGVACSAYAFVMFVHLEGVLNSGTQIAAFMP
ncbi:MAG: hypothetical protein KC416_04715 [Myxococcales bacterium]|nr:hypothetical protein [Myxococcales bacterium]